MIASVLRSNQTRVRSARATASGVQYAAKPGSPRAASTRTIRHPIEAQFGVRTLVMGASNHPNHPVLARRLQAYLR